MTDATKANEATRLEIIYFEPIHVLDWRTRVRINLNPTDVESLKSSELMRRFEHLNKSILAQVMAYTGV